MLVTDPLTFTFIIVTSSWQSSVPNLSHAECNWMVQSAPMVVAEQQRLGGGEPMVFEDAGCVPEPR